MKSKSVFQVQPQFRFKEEWETLAVAEGLFYEPLEFFLRPVINDPEQLKYYRDWYKKSGRVTALHGTFIDVNPASGDPLFSELSRRRCHESCQLALELGAKQIVLHSSIYPFLSGYYLDNWIAASADFFMELADCYPLGIRLENSQDIVPGPLKKVMERISGSDVSICLDIGHCQYAQASQEEWFNELGEYVTYIHLSDNRGRYDDHMALGSGVVDWVKADRLWRQLGRETPITLEVGGIEGVKRSLDYLRSNDLFGARG